MLRFILYLILLAMVGSGCSNRSIDTQKNPAVYFEIPVVDMKRAKTFYTRVFAFRFEEQVIDQYEMALFPFSEKRMGISGALAKGDVYKPSKNGVLIYLHTPKIDETLQLILQNGGHVLYPITDNGALGYVAEFEDTEGNRIGLHQPQ